MGLAVWAHSEFKQYICDTSFSPFKLSNVSIVHSTSTCEAKNCMGIVASSASILGFDDAVKSTQHSNSTPEALQRNHSLSTINEERSSQLYETPAGDITQKSDVSFSFDGKEVSVSLYETPDLTEEEALQIVEMYADQISEHVTEHNVVELPPLRFVKETSQSGNLLMEAIIIDVASEYFVNEDDLRTEADLDNVSINEVSLHGLTTTDESGIRSARNNADESIISGDGDDYFSLSRATKVSDNNDYDDDKTEDLLSAKSSERQMLIAQDAEEFVTLDEQSSKSGSRKRKISSSQTDETAKKHILERQNVEENLNLVVPLAKLICILDRNLSTIKEEVHAQSALMMAPASEPALAIVRNVLEPIVAMRQKLNEYNGQIALQTLFGEVGTDFEKLHQALTVVEKCVSLDEVGSTMVQRTSVCVIDSVGEEFIQLFDAIERIAQAKSDVCDPQNEIHALMNDLRMGVRITQDTIRTQTVIQERNAIEVAQHITDTMVRVQTVPEPVPFESLSTNRLPSEAHNFKNVCRSIVEIQGVLDSTEANTSPSEVLKSLMQPIASLEQSIQSIENVLNVEQAGIGGTLEEKINIALWDTCTPPMYELFKSLEILENQMPNEVNEVCDAILPPLQEIQNGLARIGQDIENGALGRHSPPIENTDRKRIIDSVNQSLVYLGSNIEASPLTDTVRHSFGTVREQLKNLITASLETDENSCLTILGLIKKPIDDLNYCFRQMEERSSSQSTQEILDPLNVLKDTVRRCGEEIALSKGTLKCQQLLSELKRQIDETEQNIILVPWMRVAKEDELSGSSSSQQKIVSVKSIHDQKSIGHIVATLEDVNRCIASIQEHAQFEEAMEMETSHLPKLMMLTKPIEEIKQNIINLQEGVGTVEASSDISQIEIMQKLVEPLENVCESLKVIEVNIDDPLLSISSQENLSDFKVLAKPLKEVHERIAQIQHETNFGETAGTLSLDAQSNSAKFAKPIFELKKNVEIILQHILEAPDYLSTMDDISVIQSVADEALPYDELHTVMPSSAVNIIRTPQGLMEIVALEKNIRDFQQHASQQTEQQSVLMDELNAVLQETLLKISESNYENLSVATMEQLTKPLQKLHVTIVKVKQTNPGEALSKLQKSLSQFQKCIFDRIGFNALDKHEISAVQFAELHRCVVTIPKKLPSLAVILQNLITIDDIAILDSIEEPIKELQQIIHTNPESFTNINEMNGTNLPTLNSVARPLLNLKKQAQSLDESTLQKLHSISFSEEENSEKSEPLLPVIDLIVCMESIDLQTIEKLAKSVAPEIVPELVVNLEELKRCIINTQREDTIKALEEISSATNLEGLKAISEPLHKLQHYVESTQPESCESASEIQCLMQLKEFAKPLVEIRDFVVTSEGQMAIQMANTAEISETDGLKTKAQPLLDLLSCIDQMRETVFEQMIDLSDQMGITELQITANDEKRTANRTLLPELERCVRNIQSMGTVDALEDISTISNLSDLKTLAHPIQEIQHSLQVHATELMDPEQALGIIETAAFVAEIAKPLTEIRDYAVSVKGQQELVQLTKDLSEMDNSALEERAKPLLQLLECVHKFDVEVLEQVSDMSTQPNITELEMTDNNKRQRCANIKLIPKIVQAISETQHLESLENIDRMPCDLRKIAKPLQEMQNYIETNQQHSLDNVKSLSEAENISLLKDIAQPLMEIRNFAKSTDGQLVLEMQEDLSVSDREKLLVKPLVDLCICATNIDFNLIEPEQLATQEDISEMEAMTEIEDSNNVAGVLQTELTSSLMNLRDCINAVEIKTVQMSSSTEKFGILSKPMTDVKNAIEETQTNDNENVNLETISQLLNHLHENLADIVPKHVENTPELVEINSELMVLERRLSEALQSIKDLSCEPIEALIAHIQSPIKSLQLCQEKIENSVVVIPQVKCLNLPFYKLETCLQHMGAFIAENPSQCISNNTNGIEAFISDLQNIESQLLIAETTLQGDCTENLITEELVQDLKLVSKRIAEIRSSVQCAESLHPVMITKAIDSLSTPITKLNTTLEKALAVDISIEHVDDTSSKSQQISEEQLQQAQEQIQTALKVLVNNETNDENIRMLLNEIHESLIDLKTVDASNKTLDFNNHINKLNDSLNVLMQQENTKGIGHQLNDLKSNIDLLAEHQTVRLDTLSDVCQILTDIQLLSTQICHITEKPQPMQVTASEPSIDTKNDKNHLQVQVNDLLRKSGEQRLTPDEEDKLNSLLSQINLLDIKIHDTVFDAKIINESTADIIEQLKEDLETRDELKKNVDSENVSSAISIDESQLPMKINENTHTNIENAPEHEHRTETESALCTTDIIDKSPQQTPKIHLIEELKLGHQFSFIDETNVFEAELNANLQKLYLSFESIMAEYKEALTCDEIAENQYQLLLQPITYIQQTLELAKETHTIDLQTLDCLLSDLKQATEIFSASNESKAQEPSFISMDEYVQDAIVSIHDMSRPPIEAVMAHLEQPNEQLIQCLNVASQSTSVISELQQPLNDLKGSIMSISNFIVDDPLQKISRNTPGIQLFIAELQSIESQLFFLEKNCQESKSMSLHMELGIAVLDVKNQLANVQNIIQFSEEIHPLLITKAIDKLSQPLQRLTEVSKMVNEVIKSGLSEGKESEEHPQNRSTEQSSQEDSKESVDGIPQESKIKSDRDILLDEFLFSSNDLRQCLNMLLSGQLLTLEPYKVLSRPLTHLAKIMDSTQNTSDGIQQVANILWDLKEKLDSISPEILADLNPEIAEAAYGELMSLEKNLNDTLGCVEDMNVTPIEAVIAHLEKPIRKIEALNRLVKQVSMKANIRDIERPLNELKGSMCILGAYILRDPLEHISRNSLEIQNFIAELQNIESQLYFKQSEIAQMTSVPFYKELADSIAMTKLQITDIQNEVQYAETTHPILITKTVDKLCKPLELVYMIIENIHQILGDDESIKPGEETDMPQQKTKISLALPKENEIMENAEEIEIYSPTLEAKMIDSDEFSISFGEQSAILEDMAVHEATISEKESTVEQSATEEIKSQEATISEVGLCKLSNIEIF